MVLGQIFVHKRGAANFPKPAMQFGRKRKIPGSGVVEILPIGALSSSRRLGYQLCVRRQQDCFELLHFLQLFLTRNRPVTAFVGEVVDESKVIIASRPENTGQVTVGAEFCRKLMFPFRCSRKMLLENHLIVDGDNNLKFVRGPLVKRLVSGLHRDQVSAVSQVE